MNRSIEAIPTWALCYLFNSDATGLTDEEIALIDQWYTENKVMGITTATEQEGECFPYFSHCPAFGLPAGVNPLRAIISPSFIKLAASAAVIKL